MSYDAFFFDGSPDIATVALATLVLRCPPRSGCARSLRLSFS